jgi:hypothetical protein
MLKPRVKHVALVGPTLHTKAGETPEHWENDTIVLSFIEANEAISAELGLHYVNTRKAFQAAILDEVRKGAVAKIITKFSWPELKKRGIEGIRADKMGLLTFDGQHTNEKGTKILVGLIAREILRWKDLWKADRDVKVSQHSKNSAKKKKMKGKNIKLT